MCSLNDYDCENGEDLILSNGTEQLTIEDSTSSKLCRKCRDHVAEILLRDNDGYCKECFLKHATHKFRAALGKRKIIRRNDSVLVAFSGKINSVVLLHLIRAAMHESTHKKLVLNVHILYIDENFTNSAIERQSTLNNITKQVQSFGFSGYTTSLSQSLSETDIVLCSMENCRVIIEGEDALLKTFDALKDDTARQELQWQLRRRLLISVAKKLGCDKVFVADSSIDVAAKILGAVSLGRGAHLSLDTGFVDGRCPEVMLLRPLRDFTQKEIVYYANCHDLNDIPLKDETDQDRKRSIQTLTKDFIRNLDDEQHGTVSAIFRTGEKLNVEIPSKESAQDTCALCNANLDTSSCDTDVSAIQATVFSKAISLNTEIYNEKNGAPNNTIKNEVENTVNNVDCNDCSCIRTKSNCITHKDIQRYLCYCCRLTCSSPGIKDTIPEFVKKAIEKKRLLSCMKKEINDFLL